MRTKAHVTLSEMSRGPVVPVARRWELVNERLREEGKKSTTETKLIQLASLMASVDDFGWREALAEDDERLRRLWMRLRANWFRG
jgi:hypothetical protein